MVAALLVGITLLSARSATAAAGDAVPGELIVKYRHGTSAARRAGVARALPGATRARAYDFIGAELVRFSGMSTADAISRLSANPDVEYAEPNHIVYADVVPNDPSFNQLWGMLNTGQGGAFAGDDIDATLAWNLYTGDPDMKIGVIDTGIDYTHPDLAANIWSNPGEIPDNGVDDEGNGYIDDVHGYDVLNQDGDPMDDHFHGTHVAGTIGAVGDNGDGIAGVNWQCKLVAIKFMGPTGLGTEADAIAALQYAIAVGVRLTNDSWGNMSGGQALRDAITATGEAGQLFICAAGNDGWLIDSVPVYPPSYLLPCMINVAATDGRDLRPAFSNIGVNTVHLGAPGANIYSCKPGNLYQALNGTSMAAPHVTGVAALAFGRFPHATPAQIRQLILDNVDPIASLTGRCSTGGRLNAHRTLLNGDAVSPARITTFALADTGSTSLGLSWTAPGDDGAVGTAARYELRIAPAPIDSANFEFAAAVTTSVPQLAGVAESLELTGLSCNTEYYLALRAVDDFGNPGALSDLVQVTTLGVPVLAVAPGAVSAQLGAGESRDVTLTFANPGLGRLDVGVAPASPAAWLALSAATERIAAGNAADIVVHLDATSLTPGVYLASLHVTSNDPATGTQDVPVTLTVVAPTEVAGSPPARYALRSVSRNPTSGRVTFELSLPEPGVVDVALYDASGRRVGRLAHGTLAVGAHVLTWDGSDERGGAVPPGLYFVRANTPGGSFQRRVVRVQ